jgi:hypothetical protein
VAPPEAKDLFELIDQQKQRHVFVQTGFLHHLQQTARAGLQRRVRKGNIAGVGLIRGVGDCLVKCRGQIPKRIASRPHDDKSPVRPRA